MGNLFFRLFHMKCYASCSTYGTLKATPDSNKDFVVAVSLRAEEFHTFQMSLSIANFFF